MKKEQELAALRETELKQRQTIIDKYMNLIELKVYQNWIKPPTAAKGLVSELKVTLIPTGDVIDVQLAKSSGDPVYDKSVQAAVKKASPLPLPPAEEGLFDTFRNLRLPMRADKKT
jgi:colicin import membrane protein